MTVYYVAMQDYGKVTYWYLVDFNFGFVIEFPDGDNPEPLPYQESYESIEEYKRMWAENPAHPEFHIVDIQEVYSDDQVDGTPVLYYPK